jgi:hypothetical protein
MSVTAISFTAIHPRRRNRDVTAARLTAAIRANNGPVELAATRVHGKVRLRSRDFDHRLVLRNIEFDDIVDMRDCRFSKTVDLRGCIFRKGLILEGTRIRGTLILRDAVVHRIPRDTKGRSTRFRLLRIGGDLLGDGLHARASMDLRCCEIQGNLDLSSRPEAAETSGKLALCEGDLVLSVARVGGNVWLRGTQVRGSVRADAAIVHAGFLLHALRRFPEREAGLVVATARVAGDVELSAAQVTGAVSLSGTEIGGSVSCQATEIRSGLFCRAVHGHPTRIAGKLRAPSARISGALDLSGADVGDDVMLEGARVEGTLFFLDAWYVPSGAPPYTPQLPEPLKFREPDLRTRIRGSLLLSHVTVTGSLEGKNLQVDGTVRLDSATFTGWVSLSSGQFGQDLKLESAQIKGGLYCRCLRDEQPTVRGSILGAAAQVYSGVHLSGVQVGGDVVFADARIEGGIEIRVPGAECRPSAGAPAARVGGALDLGNATVIGPVELTGLHAGGGLAMETAAITGPLDLTDARIGVVEKPEDFDLEATGAESPLQRARTGSGSLTATGARITGGVRCQGVRVLGDVNFQSARIEGGLDCCAAITDAGVQGERPVVGGSVLLGGATIAPQADFRAAWIGGGLALERTTIAGALRLRLADRRQRPSWTGALRRLWKPEPPADWREHRCTCLGRISPSDRRMPENRRRRAWNRAAPAAARLATLVSGPLRPARAWWSSDALRTKPWRRRLTAWRRLGLAAARRVLLGRPPVPIGHLDLRNCTVQYLDLQGREKRCADDKDRDRSAEGLIVRLEGCTFHDLSVPGHDYLFLLKRADGVGFRQSNYELVERWLHNQGNEDAAEKVYRSMRAARRTTLPRRLQPADFALGVLRDLAMQFHLLLVVFLLVLTFSTVYVFRRPGAVSVDRPPSTVIARDAVRGVADGRDELAWTGEDAFLFSLQVQFPMLRVPGVEKWEPARAPVMVRGTALGLRYDQYAALMGVMGYLMVPLVVGGIASTWLQRRSAGR